jgi:hypothetical protein
MDFLLSHFPDSAKFNAVKTHLQMLRGAFHIVMAGLVTAPAAVDPSDGARN